MTEEVVDRFLAMTRALSESHYRIRKAKEEVRRQESHNRLLLLAYEAERVKLVEQELSVRGLTWCTKCIKMVAARSTRLMFFRESREYTSGYGGCYSGFDKTEKLHRVCPDCRQQASDRHGYMGEYDEESRDQASFFVFSVKKSGEKTYIREFGELKELSPELSKLDELPRNLVEILSRGWDLPSKIVDADFDKVALHLVKQQTVEEVGAS